MHVKNEDFIPWRDLRRRRVVSWCWKPEFCSSSGAQWVQVLQLWPSHFCIFGIFSQLSRTFSRFLLGSFKARKFYRDLIEKVGEATTGWVIYRARERVVGLVGKIHVVEFECVSPLVVGIQSTERLGLLERERRLNVVVINLFY